MKKILYLLPLLLFFGCEKSDKPSRPSVLVTLPPYAYFVEKIAGEAVNIHILVPPGSNPHLYEAPPKQVENILNVAIWFQIGEGVEEKLLNVLRQHNPQMLPVNLSQGIPLIEEDPHHHHCHTCSHHQHSHADEGKDKHIWLSPRLAQTQARTIAEGLARTYPERKKQFEKGLSELISELEIIDAQIREELKPFKGQAILVSHPAFGYFCQEFGLRQISVENEGKDPLPRHIEHILKDTKIFHIRKIFTQAQYNNKAAILLGEQLGVPVQDVDPYALDYTSNLLHITHLISHEKK